MNATPKIEYGDTRLPERFWRKVSVNPVTGCWEWTASKSSSGYGRFLFHGRLWQAHRIAFEVLCWPVPLALDIDHLCRNRACCNPSHLEPVTRKENIRRGVSPCAANAKKTCCSNGHPYAETTTNGWRFCGICKSEYNRNYHQQHMEQLLAYGRQRRATHKEERSQYRASHKEQHREYMRARRGRLKRASHAPQVSLMGMPA